MTSPRMTRILKNLSLIAPRCNSQETTRKGAWRRLAKMRDGVLDEQVAPPAAVSGVARCLEEAQPLQRVGGGRDQFLPVLPDGGVERRVLSELDARLLQRLDAVSAVVLQLRVRRVDRVRGAA